MAMQIVMNHTGDTRHYFDPNDAEALAAAEARFKQLTEKGFIAAGRIGRDEITKISAFNPAVEEVVFFPRFVGG